jgi:hypothetical protein
VSHVPQYILRLVNNVFFRYIVERETLRDLVHKVLRYILERETLRHVEQKVLDIMWNVRH